MLIKILVSAMRLRAYIDETLLPDTLPEMRASSLLFGISEAPSAISCLHACCSVHSHAAWSLQVGAGRCQTSLALRTCHGTRSNSRPRFASSLDHKHVDVDILAQGKGGSCRRQVPDHNATKGTIGQQLQITLRNSLITTIGPVTTRGVSSSAI